MPVMITDLRRYVPSQPPFDLDRYQLRFELRDERGDRVSLDGIPWSVVNRRLTAAVGAEARQQVSIGLDGRVVVHCCDSWAQAVARAHAARDAIDEALVAAAGIESGLVGPRAGAGADHRGGLG
ncbi:hypothetical protein [Paraconexibacter algicola]|nr:hypothetical protein [Paraconexibacter algicola]